MDYADKQKREPHPEQTRNLVSVWTFWYTIKIFINGFKKDFDEKDLYEVPPRLQSKSNGDRLEREWKKQRSLGGTVSIFRLIWTCYGWKYLTLGVIQLCAKTTVLIIQPMALGKLVSYFEPDHAGLAKNEAQYYAALLIGLNLANCLYSQNYTLTLTGMGAQIHTAFFSLIYRKILRLSPATISKMSIGRVLTLYNKDLISLEEFTSVANDMWIGILQTIIVCVVIYCKIGTATLAGVGVFVVIMPLQIYLGSLVAKLRRQMCEKTDDRFQALKESLSAIKLIKMYTWENLFNANIKRIRRREMDILYNNYRLRHILLVLGTLSSKIAFYFLIMTYVWLGNAASAETVYFISNTFDLLSSSLGSLFPTGVTNIAELVASGRRVRQFLEAEEVPSSPLQSNNEAPNIYLKDVCAKFDGRPILANITVKMGAGINLLTGPVGSGKSFLIGVILGDHSVASGILEISGTMSYASQEPWLFRSTIKQNILFGEPYREKRYLEVLRVCSLNYDLVMFDEGDLTMVEDRGANLSKGQQIRINLARSIYKDVDIYLLDDCLSNLDVHIRNFVWLECIQTFLKGKVVVLATHDLDCAKNADNVITLKGGIVQQLPKPFRAQALDQTPSHQTDNENFDGDNEDSQLVPKAAPVSYCETQKTGKVQWSIYKRFIAFGGGFAFLFLVFLVCAAAQFVSSYSEKLVSQWVNLEQISTQSPSEDTANQKKLVLHLYTIMTALTSILLISRIFAALAFGKRASLGIHNYLSSRLINSTMQFFDTKLMGNILNRFAEDMACVDEFLAFMFYDSFIDLLLLIGIVALIATVNVFFLIPAVVLFVVLVMARRIYIPTGRSTKRLEVGCRGPVFGYLNATLEGLATVRALKVQQVLRDEFDDHQNLSTSAVYVMGCTRRAFAYLIENLCILFTGAIIATFLFWDEGNNCIFILYDVLDSLPGNVGLAISSAFTMSSCLQNTIREWSNIETGMTTVQRILDYADTKQENRQGLELEGWPRSGHISYENVSLTYPNSKDQVLTNITFRIQSKEKVGIVGRTGAGKSSIISTLFRLYDVQGTILVDGVDIKTLALSFLRAHISIIPQDPVLFAATIRNNIDPTGTYGDDRIWHAVQAANLRHLVSSLDLQIGCNLSAGQKQLICLARAMILHNKIVIMDEATANMDAETDAAIQETIQKNFAACTVITIAHKLHSILNCDRVMVLNKGQIVEFDRPAILLTNKDGAFYKMTQTDGLL